MQSVVVLGAGKVGGTIARLLASTGDYTVRVGDAFEPAVQRMKDEFGIDGQVVDASDKAALVKMLTGADAVLSACSFDVNPTIAEAALDAGASYFDLTEDVACTKKIMATAEHAKADQSFVPQCGLAPGFVSISAHDLSTRFDTLDGVHLRTGALPMYPNNAMRYNLTWSTDGLINEYGNPCEAIVDGKQVHTLPLEGLEHFTLDGTAFEAFNTSGGVGTLCDTLDGKVRKLDYKTIRYPGHRDLMAFLMQELRMNDRRAMLKDIFESAIPMTEQDEVVVFCVVTGKIDGRLTQRTDARVVTHGTFMGVNGTAIQLTTACSACAVIDMTLHGTLPDRRGFVRQEQFTMDAFLENRFGRLYRLDHLNPEPDACRTTSPQRLETTPANAVPTPAPASA
ncbi:MAG: saccharopine dehydrogenase C-terminal domain-containing protein [Planctomycetota bacterium]